MPDNTLGLLEFHYSKYSIENAATANWNFIKQKKFVFNMAYEWQRQMLFLYSEFLAAWIYKQAD